MTGQRVYVFDAPANAGNVAQILVAIYPPGTELLPGVHSTEEIVEVATRGARYGSWGPPLNEAERG